MGLQKYFNEHGIIPQLRDAKHNTESIGFSQSEQKWYGWSHRAIYGFGVGSKVKVGDCAYVANTPEGLIDSHVEFWTDLDNAEKQKLRRAECQALEDGSGIRILHAPLVIPMAKNLDDALSSIGGETIETTDFDIFGGDNAVEIRTCGKGEWTAQTLEDAKQMACDFAEFVS